MTPTKQLDGSRRWTVALPVAGLWGFAVAQPLLEQLGRNVPFLIHHRLDPFDLAAFVGVLCLGIPLVLGALVVSLGRVLGGGAARRVAAVFVGLLVAVLILRIARLTGLDAVALALGVALVGGVGVAVLVKRASAAWMFASILAFALPLFALLFFSRPAILNLVVEQFVATYPEVDVASETPVVMVVFDEFPLMSLFDEDLGIDETLFPNFAALAEHATWFRNATTVFGRTEESVVSILSGRLAVLNGAPILSNYPRNLFTLLARSHDLRVVEQVTQLLPARLRARPSLGERWARQASLLRDVGVVMAQLVAPAPWAARLPSIEEHWGQFLRRDGPPLIEPATGDGATTDHDAFERGPEFETFLDQLGTRGVRSTLDFLHSFLPHTPYRYLPSGRFYGGRSTLGDRTLAEAWANDRYFAEQIYLRHLLQVRYVDHLVGRLVARMKEVGIWESSLLVLVADHGASHWPGRSRRAPEGGETSPQVDDILRVPLFIKAPFQAAGKVDDQNVQTLDVFPTMVDLLDLDLPWAFDGRSVSEETLPGKVLLTRTGDILHFGPAFRPSEASLQRKLAVFGIPVGDADDLYRLGPFADLVGRSRGSLALAGVHHARVDLDQRSALERVDPAASYLPTELTGRLTLEGTVAVERAVLAFVINDRVAAFAEIQLRGTNDGLFSALIPERALRPGANSVEVLWVEGRDATDARFFDLQPAAV